MARQGCVARQWVADLLLGGEDDGGGHVLRDVADAARVRHHALHLVRVRVRVRVRIRRSPPEGEVGGREGLCRRVAAVQGCCVRGRWLQRKGL